MKVCRILWHTFSATFEVIMRFVLKESRSDLVVKCQSSKLTGMFKD